MMGGGLLASLSPPVAAAATKASGCCSDFHGHPIWRNAHPGSTRFLHVAQGCGGRTTTHRHLTKQRWFSCREQELGYLSSSGGEMLVASVGRKQRRCVEDVMVVRCLRKTEGEEVLPKRAVIVGAGPAGALLALLLARQNWRVDVFESKHWDGDHWTAGEPAGWSVMLGGRAAHCLEKVGLKEEVWLKGVVCTGRTTIRERGLTPKYQAYGYDMLAIPQAELAAVLINSGLSNHPSQIFYHFGWSLQCLHPDDATAEFSHLCEDGGSGGSSSVEKMSVTADLIVGADGLHSKTREELEWKTPSFSSSLQQIPAGRHLRLRVPMDVVGTQIDEAGRVHGPSMLVVVRSSRLLWGLPNCDGTMALTLQGIKGSTTSDVSKEMSESFPELAEIFSVDAEATRQLAGAKERTQGTVVATTFNYKQTVLIGDAAHSLLNVTHLGTGLALEDCLVLGGLLQESLVAISDSPETRDGQVAECVTAALARFSEERMPEMTAAANLCSEVAKTNMFQVELQQAIMRVIARVVPKIQPWQKSANTKVVSIKQLAGWRVREIVLVRVALVFALLLMLIRAIRLVRLELHVSIKYLES
ncbi:unnamed protein product [Sphagnum compactum]